MGNINRKVVEDFGFEWSRYDQSKLSRDELKTMFDAYFSIFPWDDLPENAKGIDLGCGSGRWARFVAPRVGVLHCIDPSPEALKVAQKKLKEYQNCKFYAADADNIPLPDTSADFGYSLGVLHHIPDTPAGLKSLVKKLKHGAPLLLYLYYAFDNRSNLFKTVWRISDVFRRIISGFPPPLRYGICRVIAVSTYYPMARCALLLEKLGVNINSFPLSYYRNRSLYVMYNDALDRFGTKLEHRFSRKQIFQMMEEAGLENIKFKNTAPFWCAVGSRKGD